MEKSINKMKAVYMLCVFNYVTLQVTNSCWKRIHTKMTRMLNKKEKHTIEANALAEVLQEK